MKILPLEAKLFHKDGRKLYFLSVFVGWCITDKNIHGMNNTNLISLTDIKVSNLIMLAHVLSLNQGCVYYLVVVIAADCYP
jgi:hypothetical protein